MNDFLEELYQYLYTEKCPGDVGLEEYTTEQGCCKGICNQDLQICRNCWQSAIIKLKDRDICNGVNS